jgi:serine/threonine protein kinase
MEACDGKELFDEICERKIFTENDVKQITKEIMQALQYLHSKGN